MIKIKYQKYQFLIRAKDTLHLPYYKGSTFRGSFGNAFRRVVCVSKKDNCTNCILREKCIYAYFFETFPDQDAPIMGMSKYERIPHPFVIDPPNEATSIYMPDDKLSFGLTLIGKAIDYLPYVIYSFEEIGRIGLGKGRGKYVLESVSTDEGISYEGSSKILKNNSFKQAYVNDIAETLEPQVETVKIRFLTPTRIKYNRDLVVEPEFHILIRSLLRRIKLVSHFHCPDSSGTLDYRSYIEKAKSIRIKNNSTKWVDWERYSSRQQRRMKMGGFIGEVEYEGHIKPFNSILKAGEILHIGKGTSFGLGKYEMID